MKGLAFKLRRGDAEHRAQVAVVTWATLARAEFPELALLFAIPNGGHRNVVVARKLKAEGVRAGVPDLCLPVARGGYHGLFIEMKADGLPIADCRLPIAPRKRKGVVSEAQQQWHICLRLQGYSVVVCHSSAEAEAVLREYLALPCSAVNSRGGMDHE